MKRYFPNLVISSVSRRRMFCNQIMAKKRKNLTRGGYSLSHCLHLLLIKKQVKPPKDSPHLNIESNLTNLHNFQHLTDNIEGNISNKKLQNCLAKTVMNHTVKFGVFKIGFLPNYYW